MKLLQTILMHAKMKDALLFRSATLSEAQTMSIALVKAGYGRIPRGYLVFLEQTDGLVFEGLELFSCGIHERAGTVFNHPDLLDYQQKYAIGKFFAKRLILGRATEQLICYNADNKCYEIVDRDSLQTTLKLPRFEDLLYQLIVG